MEEAGIITRAASNWRARNKFPPKKKRFNDLRVVHNFIPINNMIQKSWYLMHQIEEVIKIVIKPKVGVFFGADVANRY